MSPIPAYRRFVTDSRQTLEPHTWHSVEFDRRDDAPSDDGSEVAGRHEAGGTLYDLSVGVALTNITPGSDVHLRAVDFAPDGQGGWRTHRELPEEVTAHAVGHGRFTYTWKDALPPGHRLEFRIAQFGDADAHLVSAEAVVFLWPR
ncbi:hypothetical protein [Nocardiopsis sp. MG754419]|uniref:hypothetical protein n=1 Tax=Nocardiopsis sp. MG754419 TaxID=2259865 RepID=UPI001BA8954A|nr:hypothetical protein [Nocardiopsis sp. MG754419]MBR8740594.1 hypothetical protein [Nocardiopsis sp. MG754419]